MANGMVYPQDSCTDNVQGYYPGRCASAIIVEFSVLSFKTGSQNRTVPPLSDRLSHCRMRQCGGIWWRPEQHPRTEFYRTRTDGCWTKHVADITPLRLITARWNIIQTLKVYTQNAPEVIIRIDTWRLWQTWLGHNTTHITHILFCASHHRECFKKLHGHKKAHITTAAQTSFSFVELERRQTRLDLDYKVLSSADETH